MRSRLAPLLALLLVGAGLWLMSGELPPAAVQPTPSVAPSPSASAASLPPAMTLPSASPTPPPPPPPPPPGPRPISDGYRVQVPRLRIDLPIKEGDSTRDIVDQQTPEGAAFHLPDTGIPGEGSNTYIYAHARIGMFLSLWEVRQGDEVIIVAPDGTRLRYVVAEVHPRIPHTETKWVEPTPSERLTLQTSTGPRPSDPRFVVVAVPKTT